MTSCKLHDRVHLFITRRHTKENRTLSHRAHFSLRQSATWSETKRQSMLTKSLHSPGRSCCAQTLTTITQTHGAQNVSSASLLTFAHAGRRQTSFQLAFWETKMQLCSFPYSQLLQLYWETIRATHTYCAPRVRHLLSQATHTHVVEIPPKGQVLAHSWVWRLRQKEPRALQTPVAQDTAIRQHPYCHLLLPTLY